MTLLLDTNIVIAYFKGEQGISEKVLSRIEDIALSSLVVSELDYGAKASQKSQENLAKLYSFIELVEIHSTLTVPRRLERLKANCAS